MIAQAPARWIALSDRGGTAIASPEMLPTGRLVFEMALPLTEQATLLDFQTATFAVTLSISAARGITFGIRRGDATLQQQLSRPRLAGLGLAQFHYHWDVPADRWSLEFLSVVQDGPVVVGGAGPLAFSRSDLTLLCSARARPSRAPALLWFGATPGDAPLATPWIGPRTLIETPKGIVAASDLKAGDLVLTPGNVARQVRAIHRQVLPGHGSFAAVRLRAPYFSAINDVLVSATQQIALSGVEVEYLFGEDEVLVEARHLVDGSRAVSEDRSTALPWIAFDLGRCSALLSADLALAVAPAGPNGPAPSTAARTLDRFEVRTLLSMLKRGAIRSAA